MSHPRHARGPGRVPGPVLALAAISVACVVLALVTAGLLWTSREQSDAGSSVTVPPPAFSREFGNSGEGALVQPVGIAAADGRVYVADAGRGDVVVFQTSGSLVATIGASQLSTPVYVALDPLDGYLYVSDRRTRSVQVFATDGRFVRTFEPADDAGKAAAQGWQPLALAFRADGTLYVSDVGVRQRVLAFGPTGRFIGQTGSDVPIGPSGKSLSFANGLAAADGRLFVADSNNSRVLVLGERLEFLGATTFSGLPRGAAALADGLFVVVDTTGSELRLLGADGTGVAQVAAKGQKSGELLLPTAVASDGTGDVFVTDTGNHRISVWMVRGAVRRDLLAVAMTDARWWGAGGILLVGLACAAGAIVVSRKRRHTI